MNTGSLGNGLSFWLSDRALMERQAVQEIMKYNEKTEEFGLKLTEEQAAALTVCRQETLKAAGRVEFGGGAICCLIEAFCSSPYITQQNWEETLNWLTELFYSFKNETWDAVTDRELAHFMAEAYNGSCAGSLELLEERELPELAERIHRGGKP